MLQNNQVSYLYNPATQTKQELIEGFVARQKEFSSIMRKIRQGKLDEVSQNFLITAQRGMGKTTLLLRLEYEINATPELSYLLPIRFTEEQYNIVSFCNLWEVVADRLDEIEGFHGIVEQLDRAIEEETHSCFEVIKKALEKNEKKLLLLIDNFQEMLKKFTDNEVKELRDILHGSSLQLVTASSVAIEDTYRHDKPFFEFFKTINLPSLSTKESEELFKNLAKNHENGMEHYDASRIKIIKNLTGGVPRTMIIIFQIFLDKNAEIFENLEYILDQVTPLYKHRMDDLTPQQQRVAHEIAIAWDGVTFEELKKKTRMSEEELRGYLLELDKAYFIDVNHVGTEVELYQLKERFFNIWYLMRNGRSKNKENIKWLIRFLEIWLSPNELEERVYGHIGLLKERNIKVKGAFYLSEAYIEMVDNEQLKHELFSETKEFLASTSPELIKQMSDVLDDNSEIGEHSKFFKEGNSYYKKGDYDQAIASYEKAIALNPKDASTYHNMGNSYGNKGEYDKAIASYEKAIALNPNYASAYHNMGISYRKKGEYDKAIASYEKVIELNPKDALAYYNMGNSYDNKGDYDQAIASYEKAIELNPKYASAYNNMGNSYYNKGEYDKAIASYEKAIALNPNYASAYHNMAWVYYTQVANKQESLELSKKSVELERNMYRLHTYATVLLWNDSYDESLMIVDEILKEHEYLKYLDGMTNYFLLLLAKKQSNRLDEIFKGYPKLKNEFKPVYYTLMYFMENELEYKRMGSELEETVQEMIDEVARLGEKYGV